MVGINVISSATINDQTSGLNTISRPIMSKPFLINNAWVGDVIDNYYSFIVNEIVYTSGTRKLQLSRINNTLNVVDIEPIILQNEDTIATPADNLYTQFNPCIQVSGANAYISCIESNGTGGRIQLYVCDSSCNIVENGSIVMAIEPNYAITSQEIKVLGDTLYLCYSVDNNVKIKTTSLSSLLSQNRSIIKYTLKKTDQGQQLLPQIINKISIDIIDQTQLFIACGSTAIESNINLVLAIIDGGNDTNPTQIIPLRTSASILNAFNPKFIMVDNTRGYIVFTNLQDSKKNIGIAYFNTENNGIIWSNRNSININTIGDENSYSITLNNGDLCISYTTNNAIKSTNTAVINNNTPPKKDVVIAVVSTNNNNDDINIKSIHQSTFWNTKTNDEDNSFIVYNDVNNTYNVLYTTNSKKLTLMTINYSSDSLIKFGSFLSTYAYLPNELLDLYNNMKVLSCDINLLPYGQLFNKAFYDMPINKRTMEYIFKNLNGALRYVLYSEQQSKNVVVARKDLYSDFFNYYQSLAPENFTTKKQVEELKSLLKTIENTSFYYITANTFKLIQMMVSLFDSFGFSITNEEENVPEQAPVKEYIIYKEILNINNKDSPLSVIPPLSVNPAPSEQEKIQAILGFQALCKIINEGNINQYGADSMTEAIEIIKSQFGSTIDGLIGGLTGDSPNIVSIIKKLLLENVSLSSIRSLYNINHMYVLDDNQQWLTVKPLPEPCYYSTTVSFNKSIYVIGGISCLLENFLTKPYSSEMYMGTPTQAMRDARAALYSNRKIDDNIIITRISVYDGTKWSYRYGPSVNRYCASSVVFNNKIYLIGGHTNFDSTFQHYEQVTTNIVETHGNTEFSQNSWIAETSRLNKSRAGCASVVFDEKIFVIGGYDDLGFGVTEIEALDSRNVWTIPTIEKDIGNNDFYGYSCSAAAFQDSLFILDCNGRVFKLSKIGINKYKLTDKIVQPYLSLSKNTKNSRLIAYKNASQFIDKLYIVGGNEYSSPRTVQYFDGKNWFQTGDILPEKSFLLDSVVS